MVHMMALKDLLKFHLPIEIGIRASRAKKKGRESLGSRNVDWW